MKKSKHKYYIDAPLDSLNYQDEPPWRSYHLTACGDSLEDLLCDAVIMEVDQDGGEICSYAYDKNGDDERSAALAMIEKTIRESKDAQTHS